MCQPRTVRTYQKIRAVPYLHLLVKRKGSEIDNAQRQTISVFPMENAEHFVEVGYSPVRKVSSCRDIYIPCIICSKNQGQDRATMTAPLLPSNSC